ncbi:MAG TPA: acyltransferase [Bacteroidia bacterium]|jgi:acetyltransferase-like isoleucine patch superfamily enzyme|nr:acyltransferase [Bacteroidia bacterium]HRG52204.1 acyltransferase [Bacteroidia bacterium]
MGILRVIKIVSTDFNGYAFKALRLTHVGFMRITGNLFTKTILRLKKVKFKKGCNFYGNAYFYRFPTATISMGENCTFRSRDISNLIGVNRRCIISALYKTSKVQIGNNCGFSGVTIGALKEITIGDNLICGANVIISDYDWHNADPNRRFEMCMDAKPVIIKDNVFIGVNSIIWKGVTIGENSVIGANSVVTKSIPPNVFAGGNPCKVIKEIKPS